MGESKDSLGKFGRNARSEEKESWRSACLRPINEKPRDHHWHEARRGVTRGLREYYRDG